MYLVYNAFDIVILQYETRNVPYIFIINNVMKTEYVPEIFRNNWNVPYMWVVYSVCRKVIL